MVKADPAHSDPPYSGSGLLTLHRTSATCPPAAAQHYQAGDFLALRRLRYHLDLLEAGFRQALHPEFQVPSQRAERIALGIDRPELDTIPLWSVRRADGAIAIPFIETVLGEILRDLEAGARAAAVVNPGAALRCRYGRRLVTDLLQAIAGQPRRGGVGHGEDLFLPRDLMERVCGSGSPLQRLRRSQTGAGGVASHAGH